MRWPAMGVPMMPSPMKPICMIVTSLRDRLRAARQQAAVGADRREHATRRHVVAGELLVGCEDAGHVAGRLDPPDRVLDDALDVGMPPIAQVADAGREIARPDEDAVYTRNGCDRLEIVETLL